MTNANTNTNTNYSHLSLTPLTSGRNQPNACQLGVIAKTLSVSADWLLFGDESGEPTDDIVNSVRLTDALTIVATALN